MCDEYKLNKTHTLHDEPGINLICDEDKTGSSFNSTHYTHFLKFGDINSINVHAIYTDHMIVFTPTFVLAIFRERRETIIVCPVQLMQFQKRVTG